MQGSRLPPGEGSPGHHSRCCPPSFPPSLFLTLPPFLPPSRCRSRGPPAGNLLWTKSRYLRKRKKKGLLMWKRKKERPLSACIFHALTAGWSQFRRPGHRPQPQRCAGPAASPALTAAPRALSAPHSGPPPPGSPNTQQTSRSFLQTQHPVACLATGPSPGAHSALSAAKVHTNPPCRCSSALPGHPSWPGRPPGHTWAAALPAPDFKPRPLHYRYRALRPGLPFHRPQFPRPPPLHLFLRRAASPRRHKAVGLGEVPGRPQTSGPAEPQPLQPARYLQDQGSLWRALAFSSFSRKSQTLTRREFSSINPAPLSHIIIKKNQ
ncbi:uncharacterized protein LOC128561540 [Nycticebus coucang]|uniref:uncharacterized protein LOC128561540 n=1 Tax=Nycticebus coucang TaxID=9470 RepID=UPI00234C7491|nr:uncharacterized protein LOC128561540 [Nycticebus coucang]